ncbi:unnamed protein product, partial [Meganyctiphanes norvegica]
SFSKNKSQNADKSITISRPYILAESSNPTNINHADHSVGIPTPELSTPYMSSDSEDEIDIVRYNNLANKMSQERVQQAVAQEVGRRAGEHKEQQTSVMLKAPMKLNDLIGSVIEDSLQNSRKAKKQQVLNSLEKLRRRDAHIAFEEVKSRVPILQNQPLSTVPRIVIITKATEFCKFITMQEIYLTRERERLRKYQLELKRKKNTLERKVAITPELSRPTRCPDPYLVHPDDLPGPSINHSLSGAQKKVDRPLESHNHSNCNLVDKSSFALSSTNIASPSTEYVFLKVEPQQDYDSQIEDECLMAYAETDDKVCINCLFEYGDDDMWLKCSFCNFWLHKHCSMSSNENGALICPPCFVRQIHSTEKETSSFKTLLLGNQKSDRIVDISNSNSQVLLNFKKKFNIKNKKDTEINLQVCNYCILLVQSNCDYHQRNSWKCPKCHSKQSCTTKCGICKHFIHKSCAKLFTEGSVKITKWHCPSCNNFNTITYNPIYFQDLIYLIDGVSYECETQICLTKEEEELVLHRLGYSKKNCINISKSQMLILCFVKSKEESKNQEQLNLNSDWKMRFIERHPILKEIVSVKIIDYGVGCVAPKRSLKKQKPCSNILETVEIKKEVTDSENALPNIPFKSSALAHLTGSDVGIEMTIKREIIEMEPSDEQQNSFTIPNELRDLIPVELLSSELQDKDKLKKETVSNTENIVKQKNQNYRSYCSFRCRYGCKGSLIKLEHKFKAEYNSRKLLIKLEKLPLELCETVEDRKKLVSQYLKKEDEDMQNQDDDSTIVCIGCETNNGSMSSWLGCDACGSWWHIKCAGLPITLTKKQIQEMEWYCPTCKTEACEGCSHHERSIYLICCDDCKAWWHKKCAGIVGDTRDEKNQKIPWKCLACAASVLSSEKEDNYETDLQDQITDLQDQNTDYEKQLDNSDNYVSINKNKNYKKNNCVECKSVSNGCEEYKDFYKIFKKLQAEQLKRKQNKDYHKILKKLQVEKFKRKQRFTPIKKAKGDESYTKPSRKNDIDININKCVDDKKNCDNENKKKSHENEKEDINNLDLITEELNEDSNISECQQVNENNILVDDSYDDLSDDELPDLGDISNDHTSIISDREKDILDISVKQSLVKSDISTGLSKVSKVGYVKNSPTSLTGTKVQSAIYSPDQHSKDMKEASFTQEEEILTKRKNKKAVPSFDNEQLLQLREETLKDSLNSQEKMHMNISNTRATANPLAIGTNQNKVKSQKKKSKKKQPRLTVKKKKCPSVPVLNCNKDVEVPNGWDRTVKMRAGGASANKFDVYYHSPEGKKLRSRNEVQRYIEEKEIELDISKLNFSHCSSESDVSEIYINKPHEINIVNNSKHNAKDVNNSDGKQQVDTNSEVFSYNDE